MTGIFDDAVADAVGEIVERHSRAHVGVPAGRPRIRTNSALALSVTGAQRWYFLLWVRQHIHFGFSGVGFS
jgi:hypothetical protein